MQLYQTDIIYLGSKIKYNYLLIHKKWSSETIGNLTKTRARGLPIKS